MKKNIVTLLLICLSFTAFSQITINLYGEAWKDDKKQEKFKELMWGSHDEDFNVTEVPEKWKNYPAVILAKRMECEFKKPLVITQVYENYYIRERIKILDKAAIDYYSTLKIRVFSSFDYFEGTYLGIKIIKPDGTENEVRLSDESRIVEEDGKTYRKVALPNLEAGDIIDYYVVQQNGRTVGVINRFDLVTYEMADVHPIVSQKLIIQLNRKNFLNIQSLNGAPEIQNITKENDSYQTVAVFDRDRAPMPDHPFLLRASYYPMVRFQATISTKLSQNKEFLAKQDEVITHFPEEVKSMHLAKSVRFYRGIRPGEYAGDDEMKKVLKEYKSLSKSKKPLTDYDKASGLFYFLRHPTHFSQFYTMRFYRKTFGMHFKKTDVKYDILVTAPRTLGDVGNIIFYEALNEIIRINTDPPLYFGYANLYANPDFISYLYEGANAYIIDPKDKSTVLRTITIPKSSASDNVDKIISSVQLDIVNNKITLKNEHSVKGHPRVYMYSPLLLSNLNLRLDNTLNKGDLPVYGYRAGSEHMKKAEEDVIAEHPGKIEKLTEFYRDGKFNNEKVKVTDFEIKQTGRWHSAPELVFTEELEMEDLISRAGTGFVLNIGELPGQKSKIPDNERTRNADIHIKYAKSDIYEFAIEIPDGYMPRGLENLNNNVDNETGSFISKAKIEGDKLILSISEIIKDNHFEAVKWGLYLEVLDAAYNFSQQRIMFEKI